MADQAEDQARIRQKAAEIIAVLNAAPMDFSGSGEAWGYGGGRDLSRLAEEARYGRAATSNSPEWEIPLDGYPSERD